MSDTTSSCPVCGSSRRGHAFTVPDHEYGLSYRARYIDCDACGCLYQSPMPSDEQLASFYPATYHSMHSAGLLATLKHRLRLGKLLRFLRPGDAFLDFGCGNGAFVRYASDHCPDRRFYGYEIDRRDSVVSSNDGRMTILRGSLAHLKAHLPECRMISMHHVIEHLPDPASTVRELRPALTRGGRIVGQTPATDSFERRLFKTRWSGFHAPRHTVVFSRQGLETLFAGAHFASTRVDTGLNPAAYAVSLASALHGPNGGVISRSRPEWLIYLAAALVFWPADRLLGGSIIDFHAEAR
jgi:SAM-dependent methyltransferase